jgi:hypothetical protein
MCRFSAAGDEAADPAAAQDDPSRRERTPTWFTSFTKLGDDLGQHVAESARPLAVGHGLNEHATTVGYSRTGPRRTPSGPRRTAAFSPDGYAAALRVLTRYAKIDGVDMAREALRPGSSVTIITRRARPAPSAATAR